MPSGHKRSKQAKRVKVTKGLLKDYLIHPPHFHLPEEEADRRSTWFELFFDLVFAGAVSSLAQDLAKDFNWPGVARFSIAFIPILWCWVGMTFYSTRFDSDDLIQRLCAAVQMVAVAGMALFAGDLQGGGAVGFVVCFLLCRFMLITLYLRAAYHVEEARPMCLRLSTGFTFAASLWAVSLFFKFPFRPEIWIVGIVIDYFVPNLLTRASGTRMPIHLGHIPERFGTFVLLIIGDLVVVTVTTADPKKLNIGVGIELLIALLLAFLVWLDYFDGAGGARAQEDDNPKRWKFFRVWMYTHIWYSASLVLMAAGIRYPLYHPGQPLFGQPGGWILGLSGALMSASVSVIWISEQTPEKLAGQFWKFWPYHVHVLLMVAFGYAAGGLPPELALFGFACLLGLRVIMETIHGAQSLLDPAP